MRARFALEDNRPEDARRIEAAVDADIAERGTTRRPTSVVGEDIAARVR